MPTEDTKKESRVWEFDEILNMNSSLRQSRQEQNKFDTEVILTLVGGWLLTCGTGTLLALGSMNVYMLSYFRMSLHYDVNADLFDKMLPMCILFNIFTFPIGSYLVEWFGQSRPVIMIGAVVGLSL